MPRPSRQIDQALLASGRELYPQVGCAALSVRAVAAHAGVSPSMFHYHFESKDAFLGAMLQRSYDDIYAQLEAEVRSAGEVRERLQRLLMRLGAFVRANAPLLRRVLADAGAGHAVPIAFLRANVPRHLALVLSMLAEAERAGVIAAGPPLRRMSFLMGSVLTPMLVGLQVSALQLLPTGLAGLIDHEVLSDEALAQRVSWALAALEPSAAAPVAEPAPALAPAPAPTPRKRRAPRSHHVD